MKIISWIHRLYSNLCMTIFIPPTNFKLVFIYSNTLLAFFLMARQPLGGLGRLIFRGFTITHFIDTPHSVVLLWTSNQPVAETSTWQHTTLTRDRHSCPKRDRTHNPSKRSAADPRLRPHGHWDRHFTGIFHTNTVEVKSSARFKKDILYKALR
jgi:hypothetical protein